MTCSVAIVVARPSAADRRARIGRITVNSSGAQPKREQRSAIRTRRNAVHSLMILDALEQTQAIIGIVEGRIVHWSRGAERLYGWTATEAIGSCARDLLKQQSAGALEASETELDRCESWKAEFRRTHKDGRELAIAAHCASRRDPSGQATVIELDNLIESDERAADLQPARVPQTEVTIRSPGRMAHDFNNLLGIITLNLELARERAGGSNLGEMLDDALDAAWQGAELTSRLADFARRQGV
jgi:PAS domain S-box-containing protein